MIFDLLNMNIKKLNLQADKSNKKIRNLTQFKNFYKDFECSENIEIKKINANDFNSLYKEKLDKILLIDVRENEEFEQSSIKGSISIPLSNLEQKSHLEFIKEKSSDKEILTLCKLGKRSEKASKILMKFNIKSKSVEGGIEQIKKILSN